MNKVLSKFSVPSELRDFELVFPEGSLYINRFWMAELSPYFKNLCLNENYEEARNKRVVFTDISIKDVAIMLDFICPNENFVFNRAITDANLVSLMHCGDRFEIPIIKQEIEMFIEHDLHKKILEPKTIVEALLLGFHCLQRASLLSELKRKLGTLQMAELSPVIKELPDDQLKRVEEIHNAYKSERLSKEGLSCLARDRNEHLWYFNSEDQMTEYDPIFGFSPS